jgi:predicted ester cyclase
MNAAPDAIVREWFEQVWNQRRADAIDGLLSSNATVRGLADGPIDGAAGFKPVHQLFCNSFPELNVEIVESIVDGDRAAVVCHVTGRHGGDALGGKATGKPVDFWGMSAVRVENGVIVDAWNSFDFLTMYQQIGWVPSPVVG